MTASTLAEDWTSPFTGTVHPKGTSVVLTSPVHLTDGRVVMLTAPQVVTLYLSEAKRHRDVAEQRRQAVLGRLSQDPADGTFSYDRGDESDVIDALAGLASAVMLSLAAIEALANASIEELEDSATVSVRRRDRTEVVGKGDMVRRLGLSEKLDSAVPRLTGRPSIKGTKPWERYVHLRRLRDDLVHVKDLGYSADPDQPSAFGQLLRGDPARCVEEAVEVIRALRPEWLSDSVLSLLRLDEAT